MYMLKYIKYYYHYTTHTDHAIIRPFRLVIISAE